MCCDSWGRKESDLTEQLNWTEMKVVVEAPGPKGPKPVLSTSIILLFAAGPHALLYVWTHLFSSSPRPRHSHVSQPHRCVYVCLAAQACLTL